MTSTSIRRLPTTADRLLAFEISDGITKQDVEWMADQVRPAFASNDAVDILVILRTYTGLDAGAVFDVKALTAQARSALHVRRYAVVGAPDWVETVLALMDPIVPVQTRTFALEDEPLAWEWVSAGAGTSQPPS
jgi:hypothetical protein